MRLDQTVRLIAICGLSISTGAIFAGTANAAPVATSTATFSGTVAPSCAVSGAGYGAAALPYTPVGSGPSGGNQSLGQNNMALFDCNTNTVNVGVALTLTRPTNPTNATAIKGVHEAFVTNNGADLTVTNSNADGTIVTANGIATDTNGDSLIGVASTWVGGEDLLSGTYSASFVVTVTGN